MVVKQCPDAANTHPHERRANVNVFAFGVLGVPHYDKSTFGHETASLSFQIRSNSAPV